MEDDDLEDLDPNDVAAAGHIPRRFSRKQSLGATNEEVASLGTTLSLAVPHEAQDSFTSDLARRRPSHASVDRMRIESGVVERLRRGSRTAASIKEEVIIGARLDKDNDKAVDDTLSSLPVLPTQTSIGAPFEELEVDEVDPRATGTIATWRGVLILLTTSTAQLLDNILYV